ncbi:hypothetical protein GMMP15_20007 [Candidatus Magnetomoraceae bacterium gMMP-15]
MIIFFISLIGCIPTSSNIEERITLLENKLKSSNIKLQSCIPINSNIEEKITLLENKLKSSNIKL